MSGETRLPDRFDFGGLKLLPLLLADGVAVDGRRG
jgi:hypothetical protein